MRTRHTPKPGFTVCALLSLAAASANAQGTFIYDQQSATETTGSGTDANIQSLQPVGQSFTPTLSSVGFVRLWLRDLLGNGLGATLYVNLRSDSITGAILASTDPVFLPDGYGTSVRGFTNFFFATPAPLTPGTTYYIQPVIQSGDTNGFETFFYQYNYPGGNAFAGGLSNPSLDLWFREGTFVPEPSSQALIAVTAIALSFNRALRKINLTKRKPHRD